MAKQPRSVDALRALVVNALRTRGFDVAQHRVLITVSDDQWRVALTGNGQRINPALAGAADEIARRLNTEYSLMKGRS